MNSNPVATDCAEIMYTGCTEWHLSFGFMLLKVSQVLEGWELISQSSTVGVILCGCLYSFI